MNSGLIFINLYLFIFIGHQNLVEATILNIVNKDDIEDILKSYIPTVNAKNDLCRNDSLFYMQELKQYRIWATQSK